MGKDWESEQAHEWSSPTEPITLACDEVHVWRALLDLQDLCLTRLRETLSEDERERACRFYFSRDRNRFLTARAILRSILGHYLNVDAREIQFEYGSCGKPFLSRQSDSHNIRFNLAHCDQIALYAVAQGREVGVDLERLRPEFPSLDIAERFFSSREVAVLFGLPESRQVEAFFNCWTRKEAYIKGRGEGLTMPLNKFDVSLAPGEPAALLHVSGKPAELNRWSLQAITPFTGFVGAIAVEGKDWRLRRWEWIMDQREDNC